MARAYGERHGMTERDVSYLLGFKPGDLSWADRVVVLKAILAGEVVLPPEAMPEPPRCSCWTSGTRRLGWTDDDPCPVHPEHRNGDPVPVERGEVDRA